MVELVDQVVLPKIEELDRMINKNNEWYDNNEQNRIDNIYININRYRRRNKQNIFMNGLNLYDNESIMSS